VELFPKKDHEGRSVRYNDRHFEQLLGGEHFLLFISKSYKNEKQYIIYNFDFL